MSTLAEQLTSVQTAITAAETAQSLTQGDGSQHVRANLETLYRREERLLRKIERQSSGRVRVAEFL